MGPVARLTDVTLARATKDSRDAVHVDGSVWSSVHVDLQLRTVERHGWNKESLYPYRRHKVLFGERKYAKYCLEQRQTVSFLDLAPEIRNRIYMLSLNFGSIELAAKSRRAGIHHSYARRRQWRRLTRDIKPALGLLRVNKQINVEAAGIFYGENEFRFTARCGHDVLVAFSKTIGEANTLRLAKIVEHAPFETLDDVLDLPANTSKTCQRKFNDWAARKGLHQESSGRFPVARTITGKHGSLREYKMVVSWNDEIFDARFATSLRSLYWHAQRKARGEDGLGGVKTSLVILDWSDNNYSYFGWVDEEYRSARLECVDFAWRAGWERLEGVTDQVGVYDYRSWRYEERDYASRSGTPGEDQGT